MMSEFEIAQLKRYTCDVLDGIETRGELEEVPPEFINDAYTDGRTVEQAVADWFDESGEAPEVDHG